MKLEKEKKGLKSHLKHKNSFKVFVIELTTSSPMPYEPSYTSILKLGFKNKKDAERFIESNKIESKDEFDDSYQYEIKVIKIY